MSESLAGEAVENSDTSVMAAYCNDFQNKSLQSCDYKRSAQLNNYAQNIFFVW